ncbi:nascent polypeptide-associated complex subunit alpha, muscle-specific form-like [Lecanosticta acicola]|uniref:Nascent polypeptide-associated complex subunit alpha, muscle-specific form-like n=1 Tax=Lecanosticta acicola TaxID=111012 RepID=A0AAI8YUT2_9PEZI|nr:nascent polypeptide-associated complex subunit alpha, muscle-specific form-like [Lecanosticta acicola]
MPSLHSHFHHSRQQHDHQSSNQPQKQSSRIPANNQSASAESGKPGRPVQHVSKLAKRSKSVRSPDNSVKSSTTRTATAVTAATRIPVGTSKAIPIPPSRATPSSAPSNLRTPSLVSGSSVSTYDSPRSVLRRKPSGAIDRYAAQKRTPSAGGGELERARSHSRNGSSRDMFHDTVLGISLPSTTAYAESDFPLELSRNAYERRYPKDLTPPVPTGYAPSATPSTRYTDSPFSLVPTPSSASSYSPAVVSTNSNAPPPRQSYSPTRGRPPLSGRTSSKDDTPRLGLPLVRKSSTSSSTSTVRAEARLAQARRAPPAKIPEVSLTRKSTDANKPASRPAESRKTPVTPLNRDQVQVPPELAHLNVDMSSRPKLAMQKSPPPTRPTREGTSTISDMSRPSPVVQSDLPPLYTTYHKRTPSQETPGSASSTSLKSRFGFSSRSSSRNESLRIDSAVSPPPAAGRFHRGPSPQVPSTGGAKLRRKDSPAVGSGPSPAKTSRFGIFSRKPKNEPRESREPPKVLERPRRAPSKGPVAGTGHEIYGRFGARGRSGSVSSSGDFRSPSADSGSSYATQSARPPPPTRRESSTGSQDGLMLDNFLEQRLNPIILRGSGSTAGNTASSSDLAGTSLQPASSKISSLDRPSQPHLLPSAIQKPSKGSPVKRPALRRRSSADSSEGDVTARYLNLATRRSLTRLSSTDNKSPVRVPPPINTDIPVQKTVVDSYDTETSAWPQTDTSLPRTEESLNRECLWLRSPQSESTVRPPRRWNFFQRATSSPRSKGKEKVVENNEVPEVVAHQSPYRGVAHYAMSSSVQPIGLAEVERIAQEYDTSAEDSMSESNAPPKMIPYEKRRKHLLPSPPKHYYSSDSDSRARPTPSRINVERQDSSESKSPEVLRARPAFAHQAAQAFDIPRSPADDQTRSLAVPPADAPEGSADVTSPQLRQAGSGTPEQLNDSPRQPRLSPVGRIPAVVSKRDRDRKLSDNSFSRPFARAQPRPSVKPPLRPGSVYNQIRDMASPSESGSQPVSSTSTRSDAEPKSSSRYTKLPSDSTNRTSMDIHNQYEFFSFPPRKDSEQSYQSYPSSSGDSSWMAGLSVQQPQLEDIWNEYNDFMDETMPLKTPTTGSSLGAPFQYSSTLFEGHNYPFPEPYAISPPPTVGLPPLPAHALENFGPSPLKVPQQISRFLRPSMSPTTPDTLAGFVEGYGSRSTSVLYGQSHSQHRASIRPPPTEKSAGDSVASSRYSKGSHHSRSTSLPEANARLSQTSSTPTARQNRDTALVDIAEIPSTNKDTKASPGLRFGALMTSKWLSFGRVLFSPAHNEVQLASESKVLVVDGLSSDWSYYVALSYPGAEVYNLSTNLPGSPSFSWPVEEDEKPPPNHHQYRLANIETLFPFPKGFFNAVVFRFPTAATENAYTACISECKRVLRPAGFLEVAMLDLDLMNMGIRARKAVRDLKTRMQLQDQEVCLRNLSDILVQLIGRRGFEGVQRCIVGVPAAGRIPRSQDLSSASGSSDGEGMGRPGWLRETKHSKSQEFRLADLLEDAKSNGFGAPGKNNDESITKMVAKVGRWWYSTCYEKMLEDQSIFKDSALLRECEKQGTSFRMLICHAQKPAQLRRRTVSV